VGPLGPQGPVGPQGAIGPLGSQGPRALGSGFDSTRSPRAHGAGRAIRIKC
jgi:hypothetical protein